MGSWCDLVLLVDLEAERQVLTSLLASQRIPLDFIQGEDFRNAIKHYLPSFLRKVLKLLRKYLAGKKSWFSKRFASY